MKYVRVRVVVHTRSPGSTFVHVYTYDIMCSCVLPEVLSYMYSCTRSVHVTSGSTLLSYENNTFEIKYCTCTSGSTTLYESTKVQRRAYWPGLPLFI